MKNSYKSLATNFSVHLSFMGVAVKSEIIEMGPLLLFMLDYSDSFWLPMLVLTGLSFVRYVLFAGFAYMIGYGKQGAQQRKIQAATPSTAQIRREIGYSMIAVAVFGIFNMLLAWLGVYPHTLIYFDIGRYGVVWFVASIFLALVLQDTLFYWTHRLLHFRRIFSVVHRIHHLSSNPTPWTAYSFHPLESVLHSLELFCIAFILPMHPIALVIFQTISTAYNIYGHNGYELYPPGWSHHPIGRWIVTSVFHNAHHLKSRHNYSLYFLWWDRWMGTIDPEYDDRYEMVRPGNINKRSSA